MPRSQQLCVMQNTSLEFYLEGSQKFVVLTYFNENDAFQITCLFIKMTNRLIFFPEVIFTRVGFYPGPIFWSGYFTRVGGGLSPPHIFWEPMVKSDRSA